MRRGVRHGWWEKHGTYSTYSQAARYGGSTVPMGALAWSAPTARPILKGKGDLSNAWDSSTGHAYSLCSVLCNAPTQAGGLCHLGIARTSRGLVATPVAVDLVASGSTTAAVPVGGQL